MLAMVTLGDLEAVDLDILLQLMEVLELLDKDLLEEEVHIQIQDLHTVTVVEVVVQEVLARMELKVMDQPLALQEMEEMDFHIVFLEFLNFTQVEVEEDSGGRLMVED